MDVFNTIMLIAARNNLTHIIIYSDSCLHQYRGNRSTYSTPLAFIQVVDVSCSYLWREFNSPNGFEMGLSPVLNIAIDCPPSILENVTGGNQSRHEHDMLIRPYLNVILLGQMSASISLLHVLKERRGMQHLLFVEGHYSMSLDTFEGKSFSCRSCIIRDQHGTKVAMVTSECDYRAKSRLLSEQFEGFKGRTIHVITQEAYALSEKGVEANNTKWTGFAFEVLDFLADVLDFRYTVHMPVNKSYGGKNENGTGFGMIGMLMNKETDIIAGLITRTPQRMSVVDMTSPIYNDRTILTIYAKKTEYWGSFWRPLSSLVYPLLLVCVITVPTVLWFISKFYPPARPGHNFNWGLQGIGLFVAKGVPFRIVATPMRIVVIFTFFGMVPLIACYSGALVATFATKKPTLPFTNLEGAVQDNGFSYYIGYGGGSHDYITHSKDITMRALLKKLEPVTYTVIKDAYSNGRDYLGIINSEIWKYTITKGRSGCNWHVVNDDVVKVDHSFALPKNSPFLEAFSKRIQDLTELGFLDKWKRVYLRSDVKHCASIKKSLALPLADCQAVFALLLIGLIFGAIVLVSEVKVYRRREKEHPKQRSTENQKTENQKLGCFSQGNSNNQHKKSPRI